MSPQTLKFGVKRTRSGYLYSIPGGGYGVRSTYVAALWAMARSAPEPLASAIEAEALAAVDRVAPVDEVKS